MGYAFKMSPEERRGENKAERIDLAMYMAATPKESLPKEVANRWSSDLIRPGSKEARNLRKFMENPTDPKNEFVLFFETKKQAMDYARTLDLLMGRSGVLSNVLITVSEKSAQDETKYNLLPKQNYKISLAADEREKILPLERRKEIILEKFKEAGESLQEVVPSKGSGVAAITPVKFTDNPIEGIDSEEGGKTKMQPRLMSLFATHGDPVFDPHRAADLLQKYANNERGQWRFTSPRNAQRMDPENNADTYRKHGYNPDRFEMKKEGTHYVLRLLTPEEAKNKQTLDESSL